MMIVTDFAATLDLKTGRVESANAGHPPPYILRPDGVTALETTPALGDMAPVVPEIRHGSRQSQDQFVLA